MRYITRVSGHYNVMSGYKYDTKVLGCNKWTLFTAAKCGDIRQLDKCVDDNVDIDSKTSEGRTALHIAVAHRQSKFVKYLLHHHLYCISKGADLDLQGLNALHICVVNGDAEIYCLLQKAGFDTGITTQDGKTVIDLAKERHHNHLLGFIDITRNNEVAAQSNNKASNAILAGQFLKQPLEQFEHTQHGKLIATGESIKVIYNSDSQLNGLRYKTTGIKTMYKNINGFDQDNERAIDFELDMKGGGLTPEENDLMQKVVKANSDTLWNNHENLNGIRISAVRTTGGKAFRDNCIVLCCKFKGFLPGNEEEFPRMLSCEGVSFPVDVREDHTVSLARQPSDKLEPLACGGCIQGSCKDNEVCGTIGPFVQLPNDETGFLTCDHVIDNNHRFDVVLKYNDLVYQPTKKDSLCGEVVKMCFTESAYPSIDAAIVKITSDLRVPRSTNFVTLEVEAFEAAGIAEGVTFNTGTIGKYLPDSPLLKFGAFTSVLECVCSGIGHEEDIKYPQGMVRMKGLSKIICRVKHKQGDSGAGVFVKNDKGELEWAMTLVYDVPQMC